MAGWLDDDPNARCVPIYWLPTFSQNARYANPTSRRSEIQGWIASLQRVRAWLDAAGRAEQLLLCVGDGRGDTQALGKLELPNTVCCVRTLDKGGEAHGILKGGCRSKAPACWNGIFPGASR
jgi:hypothetical protein